MLGRWKVRAGALIVVVSGNGQLYYDALKDVTELPMPYNKWQEYCLTAELRTEYHYIFNALNASYVKLQP